MKQVPERCLAIAATITRYVSDDNPGWVACEFLDAHGICHHFVEKAPVVAWDDITASTVYPCRGVIGCTVIDRRLDTSGREIIIVNTMFSGGCESTEGVSQFELLRDNIVEWEWGSTVMHPWNGIV